MRTLPLLVLAACGQSGLLLDVNPQSADVKSVEVFVPSSQQGDYMGMPPAKSQTATQGTVYDIAATVETPIDSDGRARILLQPGAIDSVPALLVLGYNANHEAIRYAIVQDPSGPILLRHTQSDQIVVMLDPATPASVAMARMPAGATPRIVRWSAAQGGDDLAGPCVGVLADAGNQQVKGTFFGPHDDLDCDNASPDCDDNWYLTTVGAGHCVTDMVTNNTLGACQLGTTPGCVDNAPATTTCTPTAQVVCGPTAFCADCSNKTLEMSGCLADTAMQNTTTRIECALTVQDDGNGGGTLCDNRTWSIDMAAAGLFGQGWACNGVAGFTNYLDAGTATPMLALPLKGAMNAPLGAQCHMDLTVLALGVGGAAGTPVSDVQQDTWGGLVFGVHTLGSAVDPHWLALPVHVTYVPIAQCPTDATPTLSCVPYPVATAGDDTIWNCAGLNGG